MAIDPESFEYVSVDETLMGVAATAYRDGLTSRLKARRIVTEETLPTLAFLGHSVGSSEWTKVETDQGLHWFVEGHEIDAAALRQLAFDLGDADGRDRWLRADGQGWYE